jgi:cobalt/nickel transport system ATP-binding protein
MPVVHDASAGCRSLLAGAAEGAPALEVQELAFAYPDGQVALRGVSLLVRCGERVALVGPNGAGKSTFLLHLNGLLTASQGRITVVGLPVIKANLPTVRARVGLVFQNPDDQLFSPTVAEDVAFGPLHMGLPEDEVKERVARALRQVAMESYAHRLSYHLSAGEKKRISIATVLAMDPDILALDEPTAGLDPRARRGLINLLRAFPMTLLVSTHDMLLVRDLFPRMVIMDEGRIVADGPTDALMDQPALLEAHGLERP